MVLLIVPHGPKFLEICHPCPRVLLFFWARIIFYDTYLTLLTPHTRGQLISLYQPMKMWSIYNVHLVLSSSPVDRLFIMCAGVLSHCPNHLAAPPASTMSPTFFCVFHQMQFTNFKHRAFFFCFSIVETIWVPHLRRQCHQLFAKFHFQVRENLLYYLWLTGPSARKIWITYISAYMPYE